MNHFKTQQEIWKYVADGGAVIHKDGTISKFENGRCEYSFNGVNDWFPYIEPVPKTKVWRWEIVRTVVEGYPYIIQTEHLLREEYAAKHYPGYTKVPGSEREI